MVSTLAGLTMCGEGGGVGAYSDEGGHCIRPTKQRFFHNVHFIPLSTSIYPELEFLNNIWELGTE
jgi:hypothetical protein